MFSMKMCEFLEAKNFGSCFCRVVSNVLLTTTRGDVTCLLSSYDKCKDADSCFYTFLITLTGTDVLPALKFGKHVIF